jgi:hypothetical protein
MAGGYEVASIGSLPQHKSRAKNAANSVHVARRRREAEMNDEPSGRRAVRRTGPASGQGKGDRFVRGSTPGLASFPASVPGWFPPQHRSAAGFRRSAR